MRLSTTKFFTAVLVPSLLSTSVVSALVVEPRAPPTTQHYPPYHDSLQCKPWKPKGVYGPAGSWRGEILFYSDRTYGKDDDKYDSYGNVSDTAPRVANVTSAVANVTEVPPDSDTGESNSSSIDESGDAGDTDDENTQDKTQKGGNRKPQHNDDDDYGEEDGGKPSDGKHDDDKSKYLPGKAHNKAEPWRLARNKYQHYPLAYSNCTYKPLHLRPEMTQSCSRGGCYRTYTVYSQIKSDDSCLTSSTNQPRKDKATFNWERCEYKDQSKARKQLFKLSQTVQYSYNFDKVIRYGDVELQNLQTSYTQGPYVAWYIEPSDRKHLIRTTPYQYTQRGIYARVLKQ